MKVYTTLHMGQHHVNHCEDYLMVAEIGTNKFLYAVMDGCSSGTDSYFASTLTGKILRKIAKENHFKDFVVKEKRDLSQILKIAVSELFEALRDAKARLQLARDEMLCTLVIAVVDTVERSGEFMCVGDGLICINNQLFEFEQENIPDYLGYHLQEDFEMWFNAQNQKLSRVDINSFSLATDGIFTFQKIDNKIYDAPQNLIDFLLVDVDGASNPNMLDRKMRQIESTLGLKPTDDLAIVRVDLK